MRRRLLALLLCTLLLAQVHAAVEISRRELQSSGSAGSDAPVQYFTSAGVLPAVSLPLLGAVAALLCVSV